MLCSSISYKSEEISIDESSGDQRGRINGSHLVDHLLEYGYEVIVLDNLSTGRLENLTHLKGINQLHVPQVDVADWEVVQLYTYDVDWIFHLAGLADIVPSILPRR